MGRRYGEFLTDLAGLEAKVLAHHEGLRGLLRQAREAHLQGGKEAPLLEGSVRLGPRRGHLEPVAALVEQGLEFIPGNRRRLAAHPADRVDDLVLEDAGEPGAQAGARAESGLSRQGGEQGLLHRVLGGVAVAQLQGGVAQQVGALALDAGPKVFLLLFHRGDARFYKGLETVRGVPTFPVPSGKGDATWQISPVSTRSTSWSTICSKASWCARSPTMAAPTPYCRA